jgi:tRNA-2-methylthio-N6-dimethylallyladenosine synthase
VDRKYFIETYGCQMNVHDSERLGGVLEAEGYRATDSQAEADLVVINTCSVRERAEEKLYTRLGELRAEARAAGSRRTIAVTGCVAQQDGESILARAPFVDVIAGTQAARQIPALVREASSAGHAAVDLNAYDDVSFPFGLTRRTDRVRALVTIIEGCNDYCAFCVVPYTRGTERMRPALEIVDEVRHVAGEGYREVQLLGQIVNHYQAPDLPACDFARLLELVHEVDGIERIRFASPHPRHVTPRMIAAMRDLPKVCRHLHLPVQSGSTAVLTAMRRRHSREQYLELVASLRDAIPDIALSTDVIVGFPTETEDDFEQTLSLTAAVRYHSMFSFKYSPRPNTLAGLRLADEVPEGEKTRRIVTLQALQREIQLSLYRQAIGSTVPVLVDSVSRRRAWELSGRTSGNTIVNFPGPPDWIGRTVSVTICDAAPNSLRGEATGSA